VPPKQSATLTEAELRIMDVLWRKGSGTVLPACKLKVDKKTQQIEVETYQNPWDLINFRITND